MATPNYVGQLFLLNLRDAINPYPGHRGNTSQESRSLLAVAGFLSIHGKKESMSKLTGFFIFVALILVPVAHGFGQESKLPADDLAPSFKAPARSTDFDKRVAM